MRWTAAAALLMCAAQAAGGTTNTPAASARTAPQTQVVANADRLEYDEGGSLVRATGNVIVASGSDRLEADRITVNLDTSEAWASGHVVLTRSNSVLTSEKLYCNLESGLVYGDGRSAVVSAPFLGIIKNGFRKSGDTITGERATVTTCNMPDNKWHYHLNVSRLTMVQDNYINVRHAVFYLAGIPLMYVPYWERSADGTGLRLVPGYSSRMGAFLLAAYGFTINDTFRGDTHLDYRARRGVAAGQDISWTAADRTWNGGLRLYGLNDQDPFAGREDSTLDIEKQRYRVLLSHTQSPDSRTLIMARAHYLSDEYMLDDFFRPEYRVEPQPDNFLSLTRRGDHYAASLTVRPRLNDFYNAVTRIPEARIEFPVQPLGDTPFYYESETTGSRLEKLYEAGITNPAYSSLRFDSRHEFSVTRKIWFLNFVPRVAGRGTYYSDTQPSGAEGGNAATRALFETGAQMSFKMFRIYSQATEGSRGLRHVAEPYANYTYVPAPNLQAEDLYSFDDVDELGSRNELRLGLRNKLQTKRNGQSSDLLDLNAWSDGDFDAGAGNGSFQILNVDARIRAWDNVRVDCDGALSLDDGALQEIGVHVILNPSSVISTDLEYRYSQDDSSLVNATLKYSPSERWSHTYRIRYELVDSRLEEHNLMIQRNYDCMSVSLGVNHIPSYTTDSGEVRAAEFQAMFKLWLKAFPKFGMMAE
ncbi:MAG: LPS assembly protein LptD [bacterium]